MIAPEHNDPPTLYGHSLPKHEQQTAEIHKHLDIEEHTGATLFEWWQVGFLPIILAYFAWKTVVAQTKKHNEERKQKYEALNKEAEYSDDTVLDYMRKQMKGRKDER